MKRNKSIFFLQKQGIAILFLLLAGITSCKKLVEVDVPQTNPAGATVYTNDASAASVLTYLYAKMAVNSFAQGTQGITLLAGLAADEFQTYPEKISDVTLVNLYKNGNLPNLQPQWRQLYSYIYVANAAIEGIKKSTGGMSDSVKLQLTGEAKFMRAFLYFYAVNLFGDVPYTTSLDLKVNAQATRTPKHQVYDSIVADLKDAKNLLKDNYVSPTGGIPTAPFTNDRARPNKWTATAFLARVYLYRGEWANAETEASAVIANTAKFSLVTDLTKVFLRDSKEVIWHIQPTSTTAGTIDATNLLLLPTSQISISNPASLRPAFVSIFETADKRKTNWIDSPIISTPAPATKYYSPSKYKVKTVTQTGSTVVPSTEYLVVFRLAEQYLIRAEARAQQDKVADAKLDLNAIRTRAGLGATTANDKIALLDAIEKERQKELFAEWGHRWLDLKRTNRIDAVMTVVTPLKALGTTWDPNMQLWPIPPTEILLNPKLAPQNPGYN
jgi:starch-binding outer membrane protein, SusD/RagB family